MLLLFCSLYLWYKYQIYVLNCLLDGPSSGLAGPLPLINFRADMSRPSARLRFGPNQSPVNNLNQRETDAVKLIPAVMALICLSSQQAMPHLLDERALE